MSLTGKLQAVSARGYRLRWSVDSTPEPDYDRLTLALLDATGSVIPSNSQRVKARGAVVTKESEEAQKNSLVAWAEEVTRSPVQSAKSEAQSVQAPAPTPEPEPSAELVETPATEEATDG